MKAQGLYFDCQIDGLSADLFSVAEFTLEEALSTLYTLTLTLVSQSQQVDVKDLLLRKAALTVYASGVKQRKIEGLITLANKGHTGFHRTFYTLTVRPKLWLLTCRRDSRIFHCKTVPEIIQQLMNEHGVTYQAAALTDNHEEREYVTQKREWEYDFFYRLAAEEGITFWFENTGQDERCYFSDSSAGYRRGLSILYNPHPQKNSTGHFINELSFTVGLTVQQYIGKDRQYSHPNYPYQFNAADPDSPVNNVIDDFTEFDSYARYPDSNMADNLAKYRLQALQCDSEIGTAKSNCIQIRPGQVFSLSEHPDSELNTHWQPISVVHHGHLPQVLEEDSDGQGAFMTNQFQFISAKRHFRPPFAHKPTADGLEVAEIVGPAGEEIFTNELGQVKIHFHWNRYDDANENASCWVRVAQGWNGNGFGFYAIPRIGQEVIVSYLDGDIDRPLVTGCVYNGKNHVPLTLPANKTQTTFRTKTHFGQGFNELRFDDKNGQEEIYIHAEKNLNTLIKNDMHMHIHHDEKHRIENDRIIEIQQHDQLTVHQHRKAAIIGDDSLSISGSHYQQVSDALVIETGQDIHLKSGAKIVIDAGTEIVLKAGGSFISIDPSGVTASPSFSVGGGSPINGRSLALQLPAGVNPIVDDRRFAVCKACAILAQQEGNISFGSQEPA